MCFVDVVAAVVLLGVILIKEHAINHSFSVKAFIDSVTSSLAGRPIIDS